MKKVTATLMPISALSKEDVENFMHWVWEMRHLNMFDAEVIGYPRTVMCRASNEDESLLFIPVQPVLMFDAIAPKPDLTPRQEALCLAKIGEQVDKAAADAGFGEIVFICRDDRVADICARHGYEEISGVRLLRKKVKPQESSTERTDRTAQ